MRRREFIRGAAGTAMFGAALCACDEASGRDRRPPAPKGAGSRVGLVRAKGQGDLDAAAARRLVDGAVMRAVGPKDPASAWKTLFEPDDVVGIKVNALGGPGIAVTPAIVEAVVAGLASAGVPAGNVIVWDRSDRELRAAGLTISTSGPGPRCYGTDSPTAGGYEGQPSVHGSVGSCFSKILTRKISALINIPVLKDHDLSGVSLSMKNLYGVIHNPNKYHDDACDPFLADLLGHPYVKDVQRLVVVDGLRGQADGGPAFAPQHQWPFRGVLAGSDAVAVDRIGAGIIERRRAEVGLPALAKQKRAPAWLKTAARQRLGQEDRGKIELLEAAL